jgi:hybrid polyketide synthase / nonribosomal peptide synthetase ACE1
VPLVDLGVDSLVGVEIRTWSLQELGVDLPVLKILGGDSVIDLVNDIILKLPEDLLPRAAAPNLAKESLCNTQG